MVAVLYQYSRQVLGGFFEAVPVALSDPVREAAPADFEHGGDLGFVEAGLEIEIAGLLLFFGIHSDRFWYLGIKVG